MAISVKTWVMVSSAYLAVFGSATLLAADPASAEVASRQVLRASFSFFQLNGT